jgi:hypothetical protein
VCFRLQCDPVEENALVFVAGKPSHYTQHNGTQDNDIQHYSINYNDIQRNGIMHNNKLNVKLSIVTLSIMAEHCYVECHLCWLSLILSVTHEPFMLSVVMLNVVILGAVAPLQPSLIFVSKCYGPVKIRLLPPTRIL